MPQIQYRPLPAQAPIHAARERTLLISGGEGSGKSYVTAAEIVARLGTWHLCYIVAPKYDSAHKEFDYAVEMMQRIGAVSNAGISRPKSGKAILTTVTGLRLETVSSEEGTKAITGLGESPDLLCMVEAGKQSYEVYLACRARVARTRGTLILSGTIEESERWYPELINRWQGDNPDGARAIILPTWSNTALYPGGEQDPEIKMLRGIYPPDRFLERFGAVPCPPANLVLKEFSFTAHVSDAVVFDPKGIVELWIDPGYSGTGGSHYAVIAVQYPDGRNVNVIDEIYTDHAVTAEVIAAAKQKEWWANVPKRVGTEGAQFTGSGGTIDIAAKAHAAMPSVWEVWNDAGVVLKMNPVEIAAGIDLHRSILKPPDGTPARIHFNPRCKGSFDEYTHWKRKQVDGIILEPDTKGCDAMKAIQYGLYDRFGALGQWREVKREPLKMPNAHRRAYYK